MSEIQRTPMTEAMYYVLLSLIEPLHGYAVMEAVKNISNGRVVMGPGTLYGILTRMEKEKLITLEESDGRRKVYSLTESGHEALKGEYLRLSKMVDDGKMLFKKGEGHEK